ncbi:hypothetical protein, partial [Saliniramus sp.]|uniref:hypothetical protein n=1 Tax=Saliniramus sp. TaxID=2986772 RepID=UPI002C508C59
SCDPAHCAEPDTASGHVTTGDVGAPFEPRDRNLQTPPLTAPPPPKSGGRITLRRHLEKSDCQVKQAQDQTAMHKDG